MIDYFSVAFPTGTPSWTLPNTVIQREAAFNLRCFRGGTGNATLILPPQAGHSSHIADYDFDKSVVETVLKNTTGPVALVEWLSATQDRKNESIDDLVFQVGRATRLLGKVHLIGLCQGGWLAAVFTALYPNRVHSLTLIASPIDFHADNNIIYKTITDQGMKPYKDVVDSNNGIMSGKMMLLGWKLMHPVERFFGDYLDIYTDVLLGNTKNLERVKKFRTWYEHTLDLSGVWYLQACEWLFLKNQLINGQLKIHGRIVYLHHIECPIVMIAGEEDDITRPDQVFEIKNYVVSSRLWKTTIPKCGHIGCFMSSKAQPYLAKSLKWIHNV